MRCEKAVVHQLIIQLILKLTENHIRKHKCAR